MHTYLHVLFNVLLCAAVGSSSPDYHGNHRHSPMSMILTTPYEPLVQPTSAIPHRLPTTVIEVEESPVLLETAPTGGTSSSDMPVSPTPSSYWSHVSSIPDKHSFSVSLFSSNTVAISNTTHVPPPTSHTHSPITAPPATNSSTVTMDTVYHSPHSSHTHFIAASPSLNYSESATSNGSFHSSSSHLPVTTSTYPKSSGLSLEIRLLLYIVPPVGVVLSCVVCVSVILCCRKYRR